VLYIISYYITNCFRFCQVCISFVNIFYPLHCYSTMQLQVWNKTRVSYKRKPLREHSVWPENHLNYSKTTVLYNICIVSVQTPIKEFMQKDSTHSMFILQCSHTNIKEWQNTLTYIISAYLTDTRNDCSFSSEFSCRCDLLSISLNKLCTLLRTVTFIFTNWHTNKSEFILLLLKILIYSSIKYLRICLFCLWPISS